MTIAQHSLYMVAAVAVVAILVAIFGVFPRMK